MTVEELDWCDLTLDEIAHFVNYIAWKLRQAE